MQVNFPNTARAIKFLLINDSVAASKLIQILNTHASEEDDVVINTSAGEIVSMEFTSTHSVEEHIETDDCEIRIHTLENTTTATATVSSKTNQTNESTMNTENSASTSSTQQAAAPQQQPTPAPAAEDNALALKIGKAVLYTAGAGAAIAAGVWAWKKWGSSTSSTTTV
jgi:cell division septation protein DedD